MRIYVRYGGWPESYRRWLLVQYAIEHDASGVEFDSYYRCRAADNAELRRIRRYTRARKR